MKTYKICKRCNEHKPFPSRIKVVIVPESECTMVHKWLYGEAMSLHWHNEMAKMPPKLLADYKKYKERIHQKPPEGG